MNKNLFIKALNEQMRLNGDTQLSLQNKLNISQSQLSKILCGNFTREGSAVRKLIEYSCYNEYIKQMKDSEKISKAVMDVWDGSTEMETRIAHTIKEIGLIWSGSTLKTHR